MVLGVCFWLWLSLGFLDDGFGLVGMATSHTYSIQSFSFVYLGGEGLVWLSIGLGRY